jgi:transcriptional regulator with XRE-family HTH domain
MNNNPLPEPEALGDEIAKRRVQKGITQGDLADMLDMSQGGLSRIERNDTGVTYEQAYKIFEVLNDA